LIFFSKQDLPSINGDDDDNGGNDELHSGNIISQALKTKFLIKGLSMDSRSPIVDGFDPLSRITGYFPVGGLLISSVVGKQIPANPNLHFFRQTVGTRSVLQK
jgi:hypothetical protein